MGRTPNSVEQDTIEMKREKSYANVYFYNINCNKG
jgi:hypothetical protein